MEMPLEPPFAFRLMELPEELRLRILEFTDLVLPSGCYLRFNRIGMCHYGNDPNGHCACLSNDRKSRQVPTALFYTSRQLSLEAREVLFSCNKLYFTNCLCELVSHYLEPQGSYLLGKIRRMEFVFCEWQFFDEMWHVLLFADAWRLLIEFIAQNLNVSNLSILIDARGGKYETCEYTIKDLPWPYCRIMEPLRRLNGLKELSFNWPAEYAEDPAALDEELRERIEV